MAIETINLPEGPDPVLSAAAKIGSKGADFASKYAALYALVENELSNNWKGSDYEAFKTKVTEEKVNFDTMRDIIDEYSTALRNAINAHVQREEDSKGQVVQGASFD
ncbi:MAG: hypothetical protein K2O29_09340 [Ruminococcus sp.]|nr:hypothetical protein [Ruminococcus sp.]MDE7138638.1 hypothetical protein [Ruminococcus sp.]